MVDIISFVLVMAVLSIFVIYIGVKYAAQFLHKKILMKYEKERFVRKKNDWFCLQEGPIFLDVEW